MDAHPGRLFRRDADFRLRCSPGSQDSGIFPHVAYTCVGASYLRVRYRFGPGGRIYVRSGRADTCKKDIPMAYLDFTGGYAAAAGIPQARSLVRFTALEWSAIAVARYDSFASLEKPSRMALALGALFGSVDPNPSLADAKLEALRRASIYAWHGIAALPREEEERFLSVGFSCDHYALLLESAGCSIAAIR